MINKVTIKNFQSHRNTELNFVPGINIITGASDNGKSSIIRSIDWAINNQPRGFAFKSDFSKDSELTSVRVEFDNNKFIERVRSNKLSGSGYYLTPEHDEKDPLQALGSDVPEEIKTLTDIQDYNIQGQHDHYFLLQNTAGEVAKIFNDIIGLDINDVFVKIKGIISKSKDGINNADEEINTLKQDLKQYDNLNEIQEEVERLEKYLEERDLLRQERKELTQIVQSYNDVEKKIEQLDDWLEIKKDSAELFKLVDEQNDDIRELEFIKNIVDEYDNLEQEIKNLDLELEFKDLILSVVEEIQQVKKDQIEFENLILEIERFETLENDIEYSDAKISKLNKEIKDMGTCPYCGAIL